MPEILNNFPAISPDQEKLKKSRLKSDNSYAKYSNIDIDKVSASFGIALHMHQPTIPAGSDDLTKAALISNLEYMLGHPDVGDNHNAPVFLNCYQRMSDFIQEFVAKGKNPRVMLDYSGNLLWGLQQIENSKVIEKLKQVTTDSKYYPYLEWLGTMWSHAVVTSTPIPDIKLHIQAWQQHFASIFGWEALSRVKGFSPPEMHLPIHPDACYEYIKALKECGYEWLMVQEHTVEYFDGSGINRPHLPHKLVAKNSLGEVLEITALIKTQGSDTKLIGQMQPFYEAQTRSRQNYCQSSVPEFVLQISDGENGGVMMNEFPPKYKEAFEQIGKKGVVGLNGSEYLALIKQKGIKGENFLEIQPISQHRIWQNFDGFNKGAADKAIAKIKVNDNSFNLDKASWTSDKNWVAGYKDVLGPINELSVSFHQHFDSLTVLPNDPHYQESLLYLLLSQTSCFRYWGQGLWTEYAKEICRRGKEAINKS